MLFGGNNYLTKVELINYAYIYVWVIYLTF
jgi:hypothetical protein